MKKYRLKCLVVIAIALVIMTLLTSTLLKENRRNKEKLLAKSEKPQDQLILKDNGEISSILTSDNEEDNTSDKNEEENKVEEQPIVEDPIVYDGLTLNELADKLNRSMNSTISNQGYHFASKCMELSIDPYLALAIVLEETGCTWNCSYLVNTCHNIGGQKGSGCGQYQYFNSLEEGIDGFLNNLYKNYYAYGLTTPETINPKYAENPKWAGNVNNYINKIKNK